MVTSEEGSRIGNELRDAARIRVLQSFPTPRSTTNPYLVQLLDALAREVDVDTFTWGRLLRGHYEVFHAHWPENLLQRRGMRRWAARALFGVGLIRMRARGTAIVRTLHNSTPHEEVGTIDRWLLAAFDRATTLTILLTDDGIARPGRTVLIPHGHYRDWFAASPRPDRVAGRMTFAGLIRAYKNVPALLRAFAEIPDPGLSLHIGGAARDPELEAALRSLAEGDSRVTVRFEYLTDADLVQEVGESELVVLPYRELQNSGALLMALSVGRPVLVPDNPITAQLAEEVGPQWVQRYTGELTGPALDAAHRAVLTIPAGAVPDLSARDWGAIGAAHAAAYRAVVSPRDRDQSDPS